MTRLARVLAGLSFALVGVSLAAPLRSEPQGTELRPRLKPGDLRRSVVVGDLGVPIGTFVTIEGRYQKYERNKGQPIYVAVDGLNNRRLAKPATFDRNTPLAYRMKPKHGEAFRLQGYELGHVKGDVDEAERYFLALQDRREPLGYYPGFVVCRDVLKNISEMNGPRSLDEA